MTVQEQAELIQLRVSLTLKLSSRRRLGPMAPVQSTVVRLHHYPTKNYSGNRAAFDAGASVCAVFITIAKNV